MSNFFDLVAQFQESIDNTDALMQGGQDVVVDVKGVLKKSVEGRIFEHFDAIYALAKGHIAFKTKDEMDASGEPAEPVTAFVWGDGDNNGIYGFDTAWQKSDYDSKSFAYDTEQGALAMNAGYRNIPSTKYHVRDVTITRLGDGSDKVRMVKSINTNNMGWYAFYIEINYSSIDDLNKLFQINLEEVSGDSPNTFNIVSRVGDWSPASNPVYLNQSRLNQEVNLYDMIMASTQDRIDYYTAANTLYLVVADYGNADNNNTQAVWDISAGFLTQGRVIASELTQALHGSLTLEHEAYTNDEISKVNDNINNIVEPKLSATHAGIDLLKPEDVFSQSGRDMTVFGELGKGGLTFTKNVEASTYTWYGVKVAIHYSALTDLNRDLYLGFESVSGQQPNNFNIVDGPNDDWSPSHHPVGLSGLTSQPSINLYDAIMASTQDNIDYYSAANVLYITIAYYNSDGAIPPTLTSVWKLDPFLEGLYSRVFATNLSKPLDAALDQRIAGQMNGNAYITCWGDSLTAGGGWTTRIAELSGLPVYNGGTGGETARSISARQGADAMIVNNITIPASTAPVVIADRDVDTGIDTQLGHKATPLLQGGLHVNPVTIGGIEGALTWTGSGHSDMTGDWTFTRSVAGSEIIINRPTQIKTDFDRRLNGGITVIFMGQNGGYTDTDELVWQNRRVIEHAGGEQFLVLGLSSGSAASRADYEAKMTKEFGRRFVSLREYLAAPIYDTDGSTIINCYGLDDANLTPTQADLDAIATGTVPPQCLSDTVHYTTATKTVIGDMLYKRMTELNFFE